VTATGQPRDLTTTAPLQEPHYPIVPGAISRLDADVPEASVSVLSETAVAADALLGVEPTRPELIGSADGAIGRLLFTIPNYAVTTDGLDGVNPYAVVYRDLFEKLPAATELVVLTHAAASGEVGRWLDDAGLSERASVIDTDDFLGFSIWAEDGYVAIREAENEYASLVEPAYFPRYGDALVADYVSSRSDLAKLQAPLYFQGGNVLVGDDFFFIGIDYPLNTLRRGIIRPAENEDPAAVLKELYRRFFDHRRAPGYVGATVMVPIETSEPVEIDGQRWTEVKHAGNSPGTRQPLFHIDMFISLAGRAADGRYRLLVGDPRAAAVLTGDALQPHAMAAAFDNIAGQLARDFEVHRNPLPLVHVDYVADRQRLWYFATSNNALVHMPNDGPNVVLMPSYGHGPYERLRVTDERNKEIWEGLGFEVRMLGDFHPFAANLGAVHCIKKYLARS
jgi:hypothetical protein